MKVTVTKVGEPGRKATWKVTYYKNRVAIRRHFKSESAAEKHATELREQLRSGLDLEDIHLAQRLLAGTGYRHSDVTRRGLAALSQDGVAGIAPNLTFADATSRVIAKAQCRPVTLAGYRSAYATLNKVFGQRRATSITEREVTTYLDSIRNHKGDKPASPYTRKTRLAQIRMALRAIGMKGPLPGVSIQFPEEEEIEFFTNSEVLTMLGTARSYERGMVALLLFAGIRPETLAKMDSLYVNVKEQTIRIPGKAGKGRKPKFLETVPCVPGKDPRPGPPPILWEWLNQYGFVPCAWSPLRARLKRAIGRWIHDGARHTAATNFRAVYGKAATAELLTHGSLDLVESNYAGVTSRANAEEFMAIGPDSVPGPPDLLGTSHKRIKWPTDVDLAELLRTKPISHVARDLRCSDTGIILRCRKRGIPTPGRGSWTRVRYEAEKAIGSEGAGNVDPEPPLAKSEPTSQSETNHIESDYESDAQVRFENDEETPYSID